MKKQNSKESSSTSASPAPRLRSFSSREDSTSFREGQDALGYASPTPVLRLREDVAFPPQDGLDSPGGGALAFPGVAHHAAVARDGSNSPAPRLRSLSSSRGEETLSPVPRLRSDACVFVLLLFWFQTTSKVKTRSEWGGGRKILTATHRFV